MENSSSKGQAWFCTTGLPSDIVIEADDMTFHLHKFPLMAKSRKLHLMITEQEANVARSREELEGNDAEVDVEIEEEPCYISLPDFPGGSETFETAVKFCYGVKIDLTSWNVAPLRCAGEYLIMTEDFSEDNLISKTERFLSQLVLRNIKESVRTLKSCEALIPLAEELSIPQRCIDSIVARWPVNEGASTGSARSSNQNILNGIDTGTRRKSKSKNTAASNAEPWFEDLCILSLPVYMQVISAMKARDINSEVIESSLLSYAKKSIPGLSRSNRKPSSASIASEAEQRELLETIITNLPQERNSRSRSGSSSSTMTRFLFGLLRAANILNASGDCRAALERKIASQLEQATLDDLLIPSYSYLIETLYDVDCVGRILGYFLEGLEERPEIGVDGHGDDGVDGARSSGVNPVMLVGKLIDGYLSEIASDANLKPEKFWELAVALPDHARLYDDSLYRAVDVYLKAHPWITEEERDKICGVMDSQKLTLEACTHAAQNERLPLRAVVQFLFFEQLQLRNAIAGSILTADIIPPDSAGAGSSVLQHQQEEVEEEEEEEEDEEEEEEQRQQQQQQQHWQQLQLALAAPGGESSNTWRTAIRENQVLRLDMDTMRSRVHELERECSTMKKAIAKIDKVGPQGASGSGSGSGSGGWRNSLTKKLGCKFKTQVCDSHERTVIESRKQGKQHHHQHQHQQPTNFL